MYRAQAESVIKNIIREIAQECANRHQVVSETLVAFMVSEVLSLLKLFLGQVCLSKFQPECVVGWSRLELYQNKPACITSHVLSPEELQRELNYLGW